MHHRSFFFFLFFVSVVVATACRGFEERTGRAQTRSCIAPPRAPGDARLERAFPNLHFSEPTRVLRRGARWYVLERRGVVRTFDDREDASEAPTALDLGAIEHLYAENADDGLMGIAIHPRFEDDPQIFLGYTAPTLSEGFVYEYRVDRARSHDGGKTIDPASLERVLVLPRDTGLHHGGPIAFDKAGMLLAATGDGEFGDPKNRAQDLGSLFGKVLRLDVDGGRPYAIPQDNPFRSRSDARPEIWALGFRNPFSMFVDAASDDVWIGDVGHVRFEEIDLVRAGGNYGWKIREANVCLGTPVCQADGLTPPAFAYSHGEGLCVVAGFVYAGSLFPELRGALIFGDFVTGRISALHDGVARVVVEAGRQISGFVADRDGEIVLLDYATGELNRVLPERHPARLPERLSETGCFDTVAGTVEPTLFSYDVNTPLWSDGAEKHRWFQLPEDGKISIGPDGAWQLPVGSVAFKTFAVDGRNVETRMLVRHENGEWGGYSYAWNDDATDAVLLADGLTRELGTGQQWTYPSRSECFACHNVGAGRTLGLTNAQMDRDGQLERFALAALFETPPVDEIAPERAAEPESSAVESRARSYLATNCGSCHRQNAPASGLGDFAPSTPFTAMDVCNVYVSTGQEIVRLAPGDAKASAIIQRMRAHDGSRMPPLGVSIVDEDGVAWVSEWIDSLPKDVCGPPHAPFVQ